jgi:H+/Cl- antiporter ClcA
LCHIFGAEAQGAGVPELKCILSGARMSECLEFRILIAKYFGLIACLGAGFVIGRVGPAFHFGALVFSELMKLGKLPLFSIFV